MEFLTHLAVHEDVAASTQNQVLSALLFLYKVVLERPLEWVDEEIVRAKRLDWLPVVFSREEARAGLARLDGTASVAASLLDGSGLRLRVEDVGAMRPLPGCAGPTRPSSATTVGEPG